MILALDPGTTRTNPAGIALLRSCEVVEFTIVFAPLNRHESFSAFLGRLHRMLSDIAVVYPLTLCGVEWPFVGKNAQSALDLAAVCGVMLAVAGAAGVPCYQVNPTHVKQALTREAAASKKAMMDAVEQRYQIRISKDAADAVGVALAAYNAHWEASHA
jgi:Holliday junction resolvasome RuvABC endonuclease subunit